MLLDVDFAYAATFRKRPAISFKEGRLAGRTSVAVPECAGRDAPVVATFEYHGERHVPEEAPVSVRARAMDGGMVFPFRREGRTDVDDVAWLREDAGGRDGPFRDLDRRARHREGEDGVQVRSSSRGDGEREVAEVAAGMALVDGRLWTRRPEPALVVSMELERGDLVLRGRVRFDHAKEDPAVVWRLDDADAALAWYRKALGTATQYSVDMPAIDVADRAALRLRPDLGQALRAARDLRDAMRKSVADAPADEMLAYARLRDALAAFADGEPLPRDADLDGVGAAALDAASHGEFGGASGRFRAALGRVEQARGEDEFAAACVP